MVPDSVTISEPGFRCLVGGEENLYIDAKLFLLYILYDCLQTKHTTPNYPSSLLIHFQHHLLMILIYVMIF